MTGKWSRADVPKVGWVCEGIEDLGEPAFVCEFCEAIRIRYLHLMAHAGYPDPLRVGVVCAGRLEQDPAGAQAREFAFKSTLARREKWLTRKWRRSRAGNQYLNAHGFNVTVFPMRGGYGARVAHRWTDWSRLSQRVYSTESQAKLAAFEVLVAKEAGK